MNLGRTQIMAILSGEFFNDKFIQNLLDVLEVGHIATGADDGVFPNWMESLDVLKTSKGAVRSCWTLSVIERAR